MNRFRFRFKNVLRYRELLEENKKRDLGVALGHLMREQGELQQIDHSIEGHDELTAGESVGEISPRQLMNRFHYARHLESSRDAQERRIENVRKDVDGRRGELIEATKQKRIFERLEERDREAHDAEERLEEQKEADELTALREARKVNRDTTRP